MFADILFIIYLVCALGLTIFAFSKTGQELQWEYLAFKETQKYMHSRGLRWPPREHLED